MSRTQRAVNYLLNTWPIPTQQEAAELFEIHQSTVSKALAVYVKKHGGVKPDNRKGAS